MQFLLRYLELGGKLVVRRRAPQASFQRSHRLLIAPNLLPFRYGNPIHRTQIVKHGAANAHAAIRFKLIATLDIVSLDCVKQTKKAARNEIVPINMRGQADDDAPRNDIDERQVLFDKLITNFRCARFPVKRPKILNFCGGGLCLFHQSAASSSSHSPRGTAAAGSSMTSNSAFCF